MPRRQDYAFDFQKAMMPMVAEQLMTADAALLLTQMFVERLDEYANDIAMELEHRYRSWELSMTEEDKTLYSLGLRHAADLLRETDPTRSDSATNEVS